MWRLLRYFCLLDAALQLSWGSLHSHEAVQHKKAYRYSGANDSANCFIIYAKMILVSGVPCYQLARAFCVLSITI